MELRDYYNINKERTGEKYTANIEPTGDKYMLIVVSFIQNVDGKFLIQRASKEKGGKWGSTGGHPKSGENSREGMHTEILEELGINISKEKYEYVNTFTGHNKIVDLYYIIEEIDILNLNLQKEEAEEVKWMEEEEIEKLIEEGKFEKTHARLFKDLQKWLIENDSMHEENM